jgi:hypothetical protein
LFSFLLQPESTVRPEYGRKAKVSDPIGNQTRTLPAYSAVSQQTAPMRVPHIMLTVTCLKIYALRVNTLASVNEQILV